MGGGDEHAEHPSSDPRSEGEALARAARPFSVLVVDDDDALRMLVARWLTRAGMQCRDARSGEEALEKAAAHLAELDVIVCDVMMPGLNGFQVLERLHANEATRTLPVLLLTAHANAEVDIVRGAEAGAVDHLAKPFAGPILVAKVKAIAERSRRERSLATKLRHAEEHATVDALTGLFNRRHFEERLAEEVQHAARHLCAFALVMFDIDHFKSINDTYGHEEGDRALRHVSECIRAVVRGDDVAFRYGGEEFVVLVRGGGAAAGAKVAERLQAELRKAPLALGAGPDAPRVVSVSGGIAAADEQNGFDTTNLVTRADAALYQAKHGGRDRFVLEKP